MIASLFMDRSATENYITLPSALLRSEPCENTFLGLRPECIESERSLECERLWLTEQCPEFASFVHFSGYVGAPGVTIQRGGNQKDGSRRGQGESGIEIEGKARLGVDKKTRGEA